MTLEVQTEGRTSGRAGASPAASSGRRRQPLATVKDICWLLYLYPLRWIVAQLPAGGVDWLCRMVTLLCQVPTRGEKRRMAVAGARALGSQRSRSELRAISRRWVANSVRQAFDDLLYARSAHSMREFKVNVCGLKHLEKANAAGKGVIVLSGHFFATRAAQRYLAERGYLWLSVVGGQASEWKRTGTGLAQARRRTIGGKPLEAVSIRDPACLPKIVQRLRSGGLVSIRLDSPIAQNAVWHPFLGKPSRFPTGFLEIVRRTGCALLPMLATGDARGLTIRFDEPAQMVMAPTRDEYAAANLPPLAAKLESWVVEYPDQWEPWLGF